VILIRLASIPFGQQHSAPRQDRFPSQTDHPAMPSAMIGSIGQPPGQTATTTRASERYRRIARRRGRKKAVVTVGRSMLVIIWHLLADPGARYADLGSHFYDTRIDPERRKHNYIRQLEALG
jgi:hypothetical protein